MASLKAARKRGPGEIVMVLSVTAVLPSLLSAYFKLILVVGASNAITIAPQSHCDEPILNLGEFHRSSLNILQLIFIQPEIVTQFMDDNEADLFPDFGFAGAGRFNVLLIQNDVIGSRR